MNTIKVFTSTVTPLQITNVSIIKLIHRPEEGLNLKSACILVSAMVHLYPRIKLASPTSVRKWC